MGWSDDGPGKENHVQKKGCTHWVTCTDGVVERSSDLRDTGGCSEGCCDYYECTVCGEKITIRYDS